MPIRNNNQTYLIPQERIVLVDELGEGMGCRHIIVPAALPIDAGRQRQIQLNRPKQPHRNNANAAKKNKTFCGLSFIKRTCKRTGRSAFNTNEPARDQRRSQRRAR
jgi:hypothetical protein